MISPNTLATFDTSYLTRLVILCHEKKVRAELDGIPDGRVKIAIWQRKEHYQGASIWHYHPDIVEAVREHTHDKNLKNLRYPRSVASEYKLGDIHFEEEYD